MSDANETIERTGIMQGMRWVRDLWTGELKQVPAGEGGRQIIARGSVPAHYDPTPVHRSPWDRGKDHISRPLSIKPEEATPERIARENAEAAHHGTGVYFTEDGLCHIPTNGCRNLELRRQNKSDLDAGYGQECQL
jgi:hypothetical protein